SAENGRRRGAARLEEARRPEPLVDPDLIHDVRSGRRANSGHVPADEVESLPDLPDSLVDVEGRVPRREDVHVVWVTTGRELLDVQHGLPIGTTAVVLADQEEHRCADAAGEVDRVAVAHQIRSLVRRGAEQRAVVGLEARRVVFVAGLVLAYGNTRNAADPYLRML